MQKPIMSGTMVTQFQSIVLKHLLLAVPIEQFSTV